MRATAGLSGAAARLLEQQHLSAKHVRLFEYCLGQRGANFWTIASETCDRCGISDYAHFDHPQRCPAWMTDEGDRQAAEEPRLIL